MTDARGKSTTYCTDADRQVVKAIDALGHETSKTYTPNGDVSDFTQFGGTGAAAPTTYSFDQAGADPTNNLTGGTAGAGETFSLTYGSSGSDPLAKFRVASFTDAQGSDTFYGYDTRGNLTSVKDDQSSPFSQATLTYNTDGTIATATDGLSHQTSYAYDTAGQLITVTPPTTVGPGSAFGATHYTYDSLSRVATPDGRGESQSFTYDKLDRITRIDYGSPVGEHWVTYGYDGNGNISAQANDASMDLVYAYDKLNRRTEDTLPEPGYFNTYGYDKASNLTTIQDQTQTVTYGYDDTSRVASIQAPDEAGSGTETIGYAYNDASSPRTKIATLPGGATERYEFDLSGKLTKVVAKTSGGGVIRSRSYAYTQGSAQRDVVQSVTDEAANVTAYSYKDATSGDNGRLVKATTTDASSNSVSQYDYVYDKAGNRKNRQVLAPVAGEPSILRDTDTVAAGTAETFKTTARAGGSIASLTVYLDTTSTASSVKVGLYSDSGGHPGGLLATATIGSPTAGAWNRVSLATSVTKGQAYWIAVLQPTGASGTLKFRDELGGGAGAETSSSSTLAALPSSWATGTSYQDGPLSAYLTGTTAVTTSYAYNPANQLCWSYTGSSTAACSAPPSGATGFTYDAAGQQLAGESTLTYDHLGQTATIDDPANFLQFLGTDQTQLWNYGGTRYQDNLLGLAVLTPQISLTRDPDTGSVVSFNDDGSKRFVLHDRQDSTIGLLDPSEDPVRSYTYDPDGNHTTPAPDPKRMVSRVKICCTVIS